ncbi:lectin-like domain-containing protein, partial [Lentilactobacillus sunkii]|uniref:lectin-like domain-containing protein n=1 Tax=Lentilactobacillus sunkii TaxID=481719 RepID=UPI0009EABA5D
MHNLWKDQDRKVHFKMYKAGKQWVFAGLAVIGLSAGLSMSGGNVRADSNVDGSVPQTEKAVMTDPTPAVVDKTAALPTTELKQAATAPAVEKASDPQAVQTVGETQTGSDTAATPVPAENAPADAKVDGNVSPTVAQPVQDKKAQNNSVDKQVEPYTSTTENNTAAATNPVQSAAQPVKSSYPQLGANEPDNNSQQTVSGLQVQADDAKATGTTAKTDIPDGPGVVTVTPATFLQYFTKHYFNDWDATTGKFGLTMDLPRQAGNTTLQTKMYMGDSFQLKGAVMLGNHEHPETEWADGITFGFNSSPVGSVGKYGSDFGMGGLQNGFGFKLDTYSNPERDDPGKFGKGPGQAYAGGYYPNTDAFGAFAYDAKDNTYRTYNPQSETDPAAPKSLGYGQLEPNKFYPIEIDYDGKSHVMTATFDNTTSGKTLTWSHDVSAWAGNKKALSFIISASTGELYGKQKFQLKSFKYTVSGIANVKFVDEDNNPIPNAPSVSEVYGRLGEATELTDATAAIQKIESGGQYYFDRAVRTGTGDFDVLKNQLTMTKDPQDITYYFAKTQTAIKANDFTMYTGQPFGSDLKNVSVIAKDGTHLPSYNIQVTSDGDNKTPGTYDVTYTIPQYGYQGSQLPSVSKTVHATVIESKAKIDVHPVTYNVGDQFDPTKALTSVTDASGKPVPFDDQSLSNTVIDAAKHVVDSDKVTNHSGIYGLLFEYSIDGMHVSTSPIVKVTVVQPDNVTVNLVNVKNDETVNTDVPKNHQTDDQIDVTANSPYLKTVIPDGYHYATAGDFTADKVTDKVQPKTNPAYTAKKQTVTVYVAGDTVKPGDANAFTLHDLLKDSNDVKVGKDVSLGGNVGDTVVATVDAAKKAAHPGYTIVPGQSDQSWVLQSKKGSTANFYFTADPQNNITVNVVNAKNDHTLSTDEPKGHHTGDILDVSQNSSFVQAVKGSGYHYATGSELKDHTQPVKNPVYDTTPKNVNIYVAGDELTDANALVVHYLKGNTWDHVKDDRKVKGTVGDTIDLKLSDPEQQVPGYTLVPGQQDKPWTLNNAPGQEWAFHYSPNQQNSITVHFLDVNNDNPVGDPVNPQGQTGDELNLTKTSTQIHVPEGYHWATDADLKSNGKTQIPELKWTVAKQNANVYVNGNSIDDTSENALTIDHYLVDDNGKPTSKAIGTPVTIGGRVGQTITINPQDVHYAVPGYTAVGKNVVTRTLGTGKVDPVSLYYAANNSSNITIHDIDVNGDPDHPVWTYIPTGKTGEKLDLNDNKNLNIPVGYHKATGEELNGHTQPADPIYSETEQNVNVYVTGDMVQNAITVHHLRQDEQGKPTNQTVAPDHPLNIRFGQKYSVDLSKEPQKVNGYTIVPNQVVKPVKVGLNTHENVNIYYTGDEASTINVHLIDTNVNGTKFKIQVPAGHTGEVLNLDDKSKVQIPDGYHRSNKSEMPAGESQSNNPIYTTKVQNVHVYVTGNPIDKNGANALIINHYLADEKGQPTSQSFGTPIRIGGNVGEKITVDPQSKDYQVDGYTALGKGTIIRTLGTKPVDPVNLYYQANGLSNITVHYLDVNNDNQVGDSVNPEGHTGEILNLGETSTQIHVPEGYH